jgi:hypothetical protein
LHRGRPRSSGTDLIGRSGGHAGLGYAGPGRRRTVRTDPRGLRPGYSASRCIGPPSPHRWGARPHGCSPRRPGSGLSHGPPARGRLSNWRLCTPRPRPGLTVGRHGTPGGLFEPGSGVPPERRTHPDHPLGGNDVCHSWVPGSHVPRIVVVPPPGTVGPNGAPASQVSRPPPPRVKEDRAPVVPPAEPEGHVHAGSPIRVPAVPVRIPAISESAPPMAERASIVPPAPVVGIQAHIPGVPAIPATGRLDMRNMTVPVRGPTRSADGMHTGIESEGGAGGDAQAEVKTRREDGAPVPVGHGHPHTRTIEKTEMQRNRRRALSGGLGWREDQSQDQDRCRDGVLVHDSSWLSCHLR